jgi:hypothetical protein
MGITYNTSTVRDGLVLHLDAANKKSYPGSGTSWFDLSINKYNGTLTDTAYSNINGGVLDFDQTATAFVTPVTPDILDLGAADFTWEAWINLDDLSDISTIVSKADTTIPDNSYQFYVDTNGRLAWRFTEDGAEWLFHFSANNDIVANKWYNVVIKRDGTTSNHYINGVKKTVFGNRYIPEDPIHNSATSLYIGRMSTGFHWMDGKLPVIKCYNRSLSDAEIMQNFEALRGRYGV